MALDEKSPSKCKWSPAVNCFSYTPNGIFFIILGALKRKVILCSDHKENTHGMNMRKQSQHSVITLCLCV